MTNLPMLLLNIFAGGALIICGSFFLSRSLEDLSAEALPAAVGRAGKSQLSAFVLSIAATAAVQSSSAITTMTVSLAESGILSLPAAMAVVYGANIGTTITAQMMSLSVSALWPLLLLTGIFLKAISSARGRAGRTAGATFAAGLIFAGLRTLSLSARFIRESAYIMNFIRLYGQNTAGCVLFGFIATAIAHSSSATVGLTIAMFSEGVIGFEQAVAITLGDNIGTCMTAQFASIAGGARGRQVAWGHTLYNVISAVITLAVMGNFLSAVRFATSLAGQPDAFLIANAHTILNILGAMLFLPLNKYFCRLLVLIAGEGGK